MANRRKRLPLVWLLVTITLMASLSGCAGQGPATVGETKTVTDMLGREVEIPAQPKRVVCLYAATAHMMAVLDVGDRIVGAPDGVKRDILMRTKYPEIVNIATPAQEGSINAEELLRVDADIVLLRRNLAESPSEVEKLEKLNIPYLAIDFYSIEDVQQCMNILGEVFGEKEKAAAYVSYMDETIQLVKDGLAGVAESEMPVVYHSVNESTKTPTAGGICEEVTKLGGVVNIGASIYGSGSDSTTYTTLEQIYQWDPDAIIANDYLVVDYIKKHNKWAGLKAVKNGQVIALPNGISRWAHQGSIEPHMGALFIAKTFYPDRFETVDLEQIVMDYYTRFFGLEMDAELARMILSGEGMREPKENAEVSYLH